ncbi:MAG: CBS domain-containing protein [Gemmataceae bacterium]
MTAHTTRPGCWELLAEELMTENPHSIREDATVEDAIAFLTDKGYRAAPVIDESGRPVGVISQSDILIHDREGCGGGLHDFYSMGNLDFENRSREETRDVRVRDLMTPVVFQVPPDAPFSRVLEEMVTLNVHRLFVVSDDGILIGVITALDVLRRLYEEARREAITT